MRLTRGESAGYRRLNPPTPTLSQPSPPTRPSGRGAIRAMETTELERREGVCCGEDHLSCDVFTDCLLRVLAGWFLDIERGEDHHNPFAPLFVARLVRHLGKELRSTHVDAACKFAGELGRTISQATSFDPTLTGWTRLDVIRLCVEISRLAGADRFYGGRDGRAGGWRGVNWWQPYRPSYSRTTTDAAERPGSD
jgi:hypothetical protein